MSVTNIIRSVRVSAGVAAVGLLLAGCASQLQDSAQAAAPTGGAQVLAPGTPVGVGEGTYFFPALPESATETGNALTGEDTSNQWAQPDGRWVNGINGQVYVPPVP